MKHVAEFFGAEKKPDVAPETWMKAKAGNRKAMNEVVERCEADVRITADNTSVIDSTVAAVSLAFGVGGAAGGGGLSIGASLSKNVIGASPLFGISTGQVRAYVMDSAIKAVGNLVVDATSDQTIDSFVLAGSAAASGGTFVGFSLAGAGVITVNKIAMDVDAFIDGDGAEAGFTPGIEANSISVSADDTSDLEADGSAVSVAVAVALVPISVAVSASFASNEIRTRTRSSIRNTASTVARSGNLSVTSDSDPDIRTDISAVSVSFGLGLAGSVVIALDDIAGQTEAFIENATLEAIGHDVIVTATSEAQSSPSTDAAASRSFLPARPSG